MDDQISNKVFLDKAETGVGKTNRGKSVDKNQKNLRQISLGQRQLFIEVLLRTTTEADSEKTVRFCMF